MVALILDLAAFHQVHAGPADASEDLRVREVALGTLAAPDTAKPFAGELLGLIVSDQTDDQ